MRDISLPIGKYVVAVSGGVDSVVLLDVLVKYMAPGTVLSVAYFDHGTRPDSAADGEFVRVLAGRYGLPFFSDRKVLGAQVSEAAARQARYAFLRQIAAAQQATVVTAHHQDDVLETILINLIRGTGWRGLCSLRDQPDVRRPLLQTSKTAILAYARQHNLPWREDSTNSSTRYLRNRLRHQVVPKLSDEQRQQLLTLAAGQAALRVEVEALANQLLPSLITSSQTQRVAMKRSTLICLPRGVQQEAMRLVAHQVAGRSLQLADLQRIRWFIATARPAKRLVVHKNMELCVTKTTVVVQGK